jgi:myo-inositol-1(or 4)-monophosphatase
MTISDSELAVAAARAGAAIVRDQFGTTLTRIAKQDGDFATSTDIEAERAVGEVLRAARPADAVFGEEFGLSADADRTWLVDPLCGTLNFAAGMAVVAVNVALRTGSDVTAAACADPFADEVFWTLAVAWVAAGRRAAYVTDGDLRDSVHFASGIAVCRAAGCVVTGLLGQPLHTGVGGLLAAADAQTHAALLDLVRRQFAAGS